MANTNRKTRLAGIATMMLSFLLVFASMTGTATASASAGSDKTTDKSNHASSTTASVQDICNYTTARPTIRRGSTGNAVKQAQCYVYYSVRAADLAIDGDFGPDTDHWVRVFQGCAGITVDGIVGPVTWSNLNFWANSPNFVC